MSDTFEFKGKTCYRGHVENGPFGSARRISTKPWPDVCPTCGHTCYSATAPQGELVEALRECQSALAMMINPESIVKTPIRIAWAACVAAESRARSALPNTTGEAE